MQGPLPCSFLATPPGGEVVGVVGARVDDRDRTLAGGAEHVGVGAVEGHRGRVRGEDAGQQRLRRAVEAKSDLAQGAPPAIAAVLAGMARSVAREEAPALVGVIFDSLPPDLARWRSWRRYVLSALHMQQVFAARSNGASPRLSDWLQGVYQNPRWLANRGVWSILVRDLMLRRTAPETLS